jgi:HEAT repeat protein
VLFGAYRVDQEVGKLLLGKPHRMDVLASRAYEDRRAIETSLIKVLDNPDSGEARKRACRALEDYGFVARQSAALLMASDAYQRATAARTLGQIGSPSALPFMLEALYDSDQIVRTQAVAGLGALKLPAAIGAILDMARRHPDMPAALLSNALNSCSFDTVVGLDFGESDPAIECNAWTGEITKLEPSAKFKELPEWLDAEELPDVLERLESTDPEARMAAARSLADYPTQRAVLALASIAGNDPEPLVRSTAVTSLGMIDHESVFAYVLVALADESKEVSAAAARTLSRLNFDRADAYVRIMETSDEATLRNVARSCIKAGIARQTIDRLASEDRRNAYEAFSLLSLLAKANEITPIMDAIQNHPNLEVRLSAVRMLGLFGRPEIVHELRELAARDVLPAKLRTAIVEVVHKIDHTQLA